MPDLMGPHAAIRSQLNLPVPMRDGVTLYADLYRPDDAPGPFPVLLQRTPYDKSQGRAGALDALRAASHGYAVVIQDTRGRYASEGDFYPFLNETDDGYDTIQWCAAQPWASGKVGMFGRSYVGATQWLAAIANPPALAAIAPGITASDYYEGWTYQGGALAWGFALSWTMRQLTMANLDAIGRRHPLPDGIRQTLLDAFNRLDDTFRQQPIVDLPHLQPPLAGYLYDWIRHSANDDYWRRWRIEEHYPHITTPALHLGGWHDIFLLGTLRNYIGMTAQAADAAARRAQRLIVGPWHHGPFGETSGDYFFGLAAAGAAIDTEAIQLRWFDRWLKDQPNAAAADPPVRIFIMGINQWRDETEWPLARARYADYYLHSAGHANTAAGDGILSPDAPADTEPPDVFLYDPRNPVPTRGGALCCGPTFVPGGAYDQQDIETRPDVLCYTTPPLPADLEVTGPLTVTIYAATTAADTDFTAKLVDVAPCGNTPCGNAPGGNVPGTDAPGGNTPDGNAPGTDAPGGNTPGADTPGADAPGGNTPGAVYNNNNAPCGNARSLTDGIIRARYRSGTDAPRPITPGEVTEYTIDLVATSNVFLAGHRIRLEISSSNFPRFDRNFNTAADPWAAAESVPALQTIHHSPRHPSRIRLPIIPSSD